jgi:hypothetical protein
LNRVINGAFPEKAAGVYLLNRENDKGRFRNAALF